MLNLPPSGDLSSRLTGFCFNIKNVRFVWWFSLLYHMYLFVLVLSEHCQPELWSPNVPLSVDFFSCLGLSWDPCLIKLWTETHLVVMLAIQSLLAMVVHLVKSISVFQVWPPQKTFRKRERNSRSFSLLQDHLLSILMISFQISCLIK